MGWTSVFARDMYPGCNTSQYAALFDGVNDFGAYTAINWPGLIPSAAGSATFMVSLWVKSDRLTTRDAGQFWWTQTTSGSNIYQFIRLGYLDRNSSGTPLNRMYIEYRSNGTSNNIQKQYALHDNSAITGSTSSTSYWLANNASLNTNDNGYVNITAIFTLPQIGQAFTNGGNLDTFWNGQLLTNTAVNQRQGTVGGTNVTITAAHIGANGSNPTVSWGGKIDHMITFRTDTFTIWKTETGLSTNQEVATYLWNNGCPRPMASDGRWDYGVCEFENNWQSNDGATRYNAINGAGFSTDHA